MARYRYPYNKIKDYHYPYSIVLTVMMMCDISASTSLGYKMRRLSAINTEKEVAADEVRILGIIYDLGISEDELKIIFPQFKDHLSANEAAAQFGLTYKEYDTIVGNLFERIATDHRFLIQITRLYDTRIEYGLWDNPEDDPDSLMAQKWEPGIGIRTRNALIRAGYVCLSDIWHAEYKHIKVIRTIGSSSLRIIAELLIDNDYDIDEFMPFSEQLRLGIAARKMEDRVGLYLDALDDAIIINVALTGDWVRGIKESLSPDVSEDEIAAILQKALTQRNKSNKGE